MKCSARWNYSIRVGTGGTQIQWHDVIDFGFEGILVLPALPREGMRISMPDDGPEEGEVVEVYMTVDNDGRFGYRVIIDSELSFHSSSQAETIESLEYILSLEIGMLQKCGFQTKNESIDRKTIEELVKQANLV